jgi:excisionase family DNA binding protein
MSTTGNQFVQEIAEAVAAKLRMEKPSKRVLTLDEAAEYVGLTPAALRQKAQRGAVPIVRFDKKFRFDRISLDLWIDSNTFESE